MWGTNPSKKEHGPQQSYMCGKCHTTFSSKSSKDNHNCSVPRATEVIDVKLIENGSIKQNPKMIPKI